MSIPLIDLSKLIHESESVRQSEIAALDKACREIGFFYLINTGIPTELMSALMREAKRFFNQPQEVKNRIDIKNSINHRGYGNIGEEQLDEIGHADWKETFDMALDFPKDHPLAVKYPTAYGPNQNPTDPLPAWRRLWQALPPVPAGLDWTPPRRPLIDPSKEISAAVSEIEAGLTSRQRKQREMGYDPDEIARERAE